MALRQFCQEGNLKWVSLLMWPGANPRSRGPALDDALTAKWLSTLKDFPIRQRPASFNLDSVIEKMMPRT